MDLTDRLCVALAGEPSDACPGDLAIAAEGVVVAWLRDLAETAEVHETDRAVMRYLAEWVESGQR